jgi:hypothetical protein
MVRKLPLFGEPRTEISFAAFSGFQGGKEGLLLLGDRAAAMGRCAIGLAAFYRAEQRVAQGVWRRHSGMSCRSLANEVESRFVSRKRL